jgi:hypothetical protein
MYNVTMRGVRKRRNAINITYSECVFVPLIIQHALRIRRVILSPLACRAVQNFPHYLINCVIVGQKSY